MRLNARPLDRPELLTQSTKLLLPYFSNSDCMLFSSPRPTTTTTSSFSCFSTKKSEKNDKNSTKKYHTPQNHYYQKLQISKSGWLIYGMNVFFLLFFPGLLGVVLLKLPKYQNNKQTKNLLANSFDFLCFF